MDSVIVGYIFGLIIALIIHIILCLLFSGWAEEKGYSRTTWFWLCFFFGSFCFMISAALPDIMLRHQVTELRILLEKTIPVACEKPSKIFATKADQIWLCKNCGTSNSTTHSQCKKCGLLRGTTANGAPVSDTDTEKAAPVLESTPVSLPNKWVCKGCGTENSMNHGQCKKCGQFK